MPWVMRVAGIYYQDSVAALTVPASNSKVLAQPYASLLPSAVARYTTWSKTMVLPALSAIRAAARRIGQGVPKAGQNATGISIRLPVSNWCMLLLRNDFS
jgi:hypothetical protein